MKKIIVFASGSGTNFQALAQKCQAGAINGKIVLLISNSANAGALERAKKFRIPSVVVNPKKFSSRKKLDEHLVKLCRNKKADLICLAGYMLKVGDKLLKNFSGKIMNIHPALLPVFGGKGFYGDKVHKAVLQKGVCVSGVTVHFVDAKYDNGPIILQKEVSILPSDTLATLSAKIHKLEHILYPDAVGVFCDGRLKVVNGKVKILPDKKSFKNIKTALISVSDKTGIVDFAKKLCSLGIEIISTAGTAKLLSSNGISVTALETLTGFNEMISGRVKTLHPCVHASILFDRENKSHVKQIGELNYKPIDLVAVNLYPFRETAKKTKGVFSKKLIEQIDIGGVTLLRAAAKNFRFVTVVSNPCDYESVAGEIKSKGNTSPDTRKSLAVKAFAHTADYDSEIFNTFSKRSGNEFPQKMNLCLNKLLDLRYGENPHQKAALYSKDKHLSFKKLHGKELSYNNLLDVDCAFQTVCEFGEPAVAIVKHLTPCGVAQSTNINSAFIIAWKCDPLSAFGGIIALNRKMTYEIAKTLSGYFVEVVIAPQYDKKALKLLSKKKNLRILEKEIRLEKSLQIRSAGTEVLVSTPDDKLIKNFRIVTKKKPTAKEKKAMLFAYKVCKHVKSNAIVLTSANATVAIGAGQMSRVDAVKMAGLKYKAYLEKNPKPKMLVMGSDAFFPFDDAVVEAKKLGVSAVIQPGGSIKDMEVIKTCNRLGLAMVCAGIRHFKH
ncbi:MAG TPA: bifunctional phosphoribosylaminoimidazolecarboxamide formyltransferase/IMP cyclohydrolase [Elusimicrobiales bacterium]|nr:bifunctional phosphoribosylaminoimidazolecarboxamide formyltransferase/IMP cyclohydrolase [Elusimicrobiales bacterium]